jgi:hypothetical protein
MQTKFGKSKGTLILRKKERAHTSYISSQIHMDKQHSYSVAQFSPSLLKQLHSIDLPSLLPPIKTDPSMIP